MATPPVSGRCALQKRQFCSSTNASRSEKSRDSPARRKLTFGKLPYQDEKIFLDVVGCKDIQQVEQDLQHLGASIEKFLTPETTCVVSNRPALKERSSTSQKLFSSGAVSSPGVIASRGRALLQKSTSNSSAQSSDVLNTAKSRGLRIVSLKEVFKVIKRESHREGFPTPLRRGVKARVAIKNLNGIFIKVEDSSCQFRPSIGRFDEFPRAFSIEDIDPSKDAAKSLSPKSSPAKLEAKSSNHKLHLSSHQERSHRKTVKGHGKSQGKKFKNRGYCELCDVWYEDLKQHTNSLVHKEYAENDENFDVLVATMDSLPVLKDLIVNLTLSITPKQGCDPHTDTSYSSSISMPSLQRVSPLETFHKQNGASQGKSPPSIDLVDSNRDNTEHKSDSKLSNPGLKDITNIMKDDLWMTVHNIQNRCVKTDPPTYRKGKNRVKETDFVSLKLRKRSCSVDNLPVITRSPCGAVATSDTLATVKTVCKESSKPIVPNPPEDSSLPLDRVTVSVQNDNLRNANCSPNSQIRHVSPTKAKKYELLSKSAPSGDGILVKHVPAESQGNEHDEILVVSVPDVCGKRETEQSAKLQGLLPSASAVSCEAELQTSENNETALDQDDMLCKASANDFEPQPNTYNAPDCQNVTQEENCKRESPKDLEKESQMERSPTSSQLNFGNAFKQLGNQESLELSEHVEMYSSTSCASQQSLAEKLDKIICNIVHNYQSEDGKESEEEKESSHVDAESSSLHSFISQYREAWLTLDEEYSRDSLFVDADTEVSMSSNTFLTGIARLYEQSKSVGETSQSMNEDEQEEEDASSYVELNDVKGAFPTDFAQARQLYGLDENFNRINTEEHKAMPSTQFQDNLSSKMKKCNSEFSIESKTGNVTEKDTEPSECSSNVHEMVAEKSENSVSSQLGEAAHDIMDSAASSESSTSKKDSTIDVNESESSCDLDETLLYNSDSERHDPSFDPSQDTTSTCDSDATIGASDQDESFAPSTSTSPAADKVNTNFASLRSSMDTRPATSGQERYLPLVPQSEDFEPPTSEVDVVTCDMLESPQANRWQVVNGQCSQLKLKLRPAPGTAWESEESVDSSNSQWASSPMHPAHHLPGLKLKLSRKAPKTPLTDLASCSKIKWSVKRSGDCKLVFRSTGNAKIARKRQRDLTLENPVTEVRRSSKRRRLCFEGMYTETLLGF